MGINIREEKVPEMDLNQDQLKRAKRSVILKTEVDGQTFVEEMDVSGGILIAYYMGKEHKMRGAMTGQQRADTIFILFEHLKKDDPQVAGQILDHIMKNL